MFKLILPLRFIFFTEPCKLVSRTAIKSFVLCTKDSLL
ncbi:hypothetical protein Leryth_021950 [Lithospermum erythrorhizon]|nr:hypothetical protein Leryth_021950 [Lithospermum erythrorhizon]